MRCYQHPEIDAVGVCVNCGRGVCEKCSVMIGGKLYCKVDADTVFGHGKEQELEIAPERASSITISGIVFIVFGLIGFGVSVLIIMTSIILGAASSVIPAFTGGTSLGSAFSTNLATTSIITYLVGIIYLVVSILGVISGWWLWGSKKNGAILGYVPILSGIITGLFILYIGRNLPAFEISTLILGVNFVLALLVAMGWNSLTGSGEITPESA